MVRFYLSRLLGGSENRRPDRRQDRVLNTCLYTFHCIIESSQIGCPVSWSVFGMGMLSLCHAPSREHGGLVGRTWWVTTHPHALGQKFPDTTHGTGILGWLKRGGILLHDVLFHPPATLLPAHIIAMAIVAHYHYANATSSSAAAGGVVLRCLRMVGKGSSERSKRLTLRRWRQWPGTRGMTCHWRPFAAAISRKTSMKLGQQMTEYSENCLL